ncbi:hypothetical protein F7734_54110 [Scytonema sp. UIC 10036]|uniref:hypothetical protein n=1 Tax=Scytonema sp. UIC 10036 TaxID=2304196 RepID=UPI0012DA448E|nr:hypothetical protein [Scytonema sp. UIC 10036]MUH00738.1 hypothetical protein [Scytonema sp. UIC 10036]
MGALNLFSVAENFLTDLSAEDESTITGGGKRGKYNSSKSRSKSKSKSGSKSKS